MALEWIVKQEFHEAMRIGLMTGVSDGRGGIVGKLVRGNITARTFTLYIYGIKNAELCERRCLCGYCYQQFGAGQMERVAQNLVVVSYIRTPMGVLETIMKLRNLGITREIGVSAEYVEACEIHICYK